MNIADCGLRIADWIADCGLDCGLRIRLRIAIRNPQSEIRNGYGCAVVDTLPPACLVYLLNQLIM
jgi:hypothetical protein